MLIFFLTFSIFPPRQLRITVYTFKALLHDFLSGADKTVLLLFLVLSHFHLTVHLAILMLLVNLSYYHTFILKEVARLITSANNATQPTNSQAIVHY